MKAFRDERFPGCVLVSVPHRKLFRAFVSSLVENHRAEMEEHEEGFVLSNHLYKEAVHIVEVCGSSSRPIATIK